MEDIKVSGLTYQGIDRIQIPKSDGSGYVNFWEADSLLNMIANNTVDYYENPYITTAAEGSLCMIRAKTCYLPNFSTCQGSSVFGKVYTENLVVPNLTNVGTNMSFLSGVKTIDTGKNLSKITQYTFCTETTVILRCTSVPTLESTTNVFQNGATVYVPSALLAEFKSMEKWSDLVSEGVITFAAIEGSAYESPNWFKEG